MSPYFVISLACQAALLLAGAPASTPGKPVPSLSAHGDAAAGHVTLEWQSGGEATSPEFMLEESVTEDFRDARVRYRGPHHASVLSGMADGTYFFRVRSRPSADTPWGAWSAPQRFTVEHHPLPLALVLFGMGAAVFGLTLVFLLVSSRKASS
jgi:hypothetical protein